MKTTMKTRHILCSILCAGMGAWGADRQDPPADGENTPPPMERQDRTDNKAILVSTAPLKLYEIAPESILENPEAVAGAQLFYAVPEKDRNGNTLPASLLGTGMALVVPHQGVSRVEARGEKNVYCFGSLDHLLGYTREQPKYWMRPSASFFSIYHATARDTDDWRKIPKVTLDFAKYYDTITGEKGKKMIDRHIGATGAPPSLKEALVVQKGAPDAVNFASCPWDGMLDRLEPGRHDGESGDAKYISSCFDGVQQHYSEVGIAKAGLPQVFPWARIWAISLHPTWVKHRTQAYGKRQSTRYCWTDMNGGLLNKTPGAYDGLLFLKNAKMHTRDYKKIAEVDAEAKQDDAWLYHFVPLSAAVAVQEEFLPYNIDRQRISRAQAVISTSNRPVNAPPPAYVLAIMADWNRTSQDGFTGEDALTVNKDFNPQGGYANAVRVPEYSQVPLDAQSAGSGNCYLDVQFKNGIATPSLGIPTGADGKRVLHVSNSWPQSPIAYQAGLEQTVELRAVVALPTRTGNRQEKPESDNTSRIWELKFKARDEVKNDTFLDGNVPDLNIASVTPENLSHVFPSQDIAIEPIQSAQNITIIDDRIPEASDIEPESRQNSTTYDLYLVKIKGGTAKSIIAAGEMYYQWNFSCKLGEATRHLTPIQTDLQKVYNIFGPSTWPVSGKVETSVAANQQSAAILPWEDALNTMTRLWLCDSNYGDESRLVWRPRYNSYALLRISAAKRLTRGIFCSYQYPQKYLDPKMGDYVWICFKTAKEYHFTNPEQYNEYKTIVFTDDTVRGPVALSIGGYTMQLNEYGGERHKRVIGYFNALDAKLLCNGFSAPDSDYILHQKRVICQDAADALVVIPRIMGFPPGLKTAGIWKTEEQEIVYNSKPTNTILPVEGHAICVMDEEVYDATPSTFQCTVPYLEPRLMDAPEDTWDIQRTGHSAKSISEYMREMGYDTSFLNIEACLQVQHPLIFTNNQ